jgi:hypothetical protein
VTGRHLSVFARIDFIQISADSSDDVHEENQGHLVIAVDRFTFELPEIIFWQGDVRVYQCDVLEVAAITMPVAPPLRGSAG